MLHMVIIYQVRQSLCALPSKQIEDKANMSKLQPKPYLYRITYMSHLYNQCGWPGAKASMTNTGKALVEPSAASTASKKHIANCDGGDGSCDGLLHAYPCFRPLSQGLL